MRVRRSERGSAAIEFAAVIPLVAVCLLFVAQASLLVWDQLRVTHAAREGARELAVANDATSARDAALRAAGLSSDRTTVTVDPSNRPVGSDAYVIVTYRAPMIVPFVDRFLDGFTLSSSVAIRVERDPP